jgi:hypothetical protein
MQIEGQHFFTTFLGFEFIISVTIFNVLQLLPTVHFIKEPESQQSKVKKFVFYELKFYHIYMLVLY